MSIKKANRESELITARKYAQAFMNLYINQLTFDQIYNLERFIEYLDENKEAFFIAELPIFSENKKYDIFFGLLEKYRLDNIFGNLIRVLIESKRLILLSDILKFISELYKDKLNIMDFTIISSHNLTKENINKIILYLKRATGKIVNYEIKIDKNLIAGLKIYSKKYGFEYSIKKQLSAISAI